MPFETVSRPSSMKTGLEQPNSDSPRLRSKDEPTVFKTSTPLRVSAGLYNVSGPRSKSAELTQFILSYLEDDTLSLLSCSRTHKHLSSPVRGVLVRTVVLGALTGKDLHRKYTAFRQSLLTSNLASSIRSLCLRFGKGISWNENKDYYQLEKDATLPSTLALIVNLKNLTIHDGSGALVTFPTALRPSLLTLFASPSLRKLELRGVKRMDDLYLQHFTNLKHLTLVDGFLNTTKKGGEDTASLNVKKCPLESLSVFSCHKLIFQELTALSSNPTSAFDISRLRACHFLFAPSHEPWQRKDRGAAAWDIALQNKYTLESLHWHWHPSYFDRPLCLDISILPSLRHLSVALEPMLFVDESMGNTPQVLDLAMPGNVIESIEIGIQLSKDRLYFGAWEETLDGIGRLPRFHV